MPKAKWNEPKVQRLATAALLCFQGWSYKDYRDAKESDPIAFPNITMAEWMEAWKYEEYVHEAVAHMIEERR